MAKIDFCLTKNDGVCAIESILSIVPFIVYITLGYYSYKETQAVTAYARESWTWRHIFKLVMSALLAVGSFLFLIVYLLTETDVSMKTVVAWGATCFLWVFNSVLMRKEFEKLGYTTNYLKIAWIIVFVCQTILIIMAAAGLNTDDFQSVMAIYILDEVFLLVMILSGYYLSDDYPTRANEDLYSSIASDVGLEVDEESYKVLTGQARTAPAAHEEHKEDDNFRPFPVEGDGRRLSGISRQSGAILNRESQLNEARERPSQGFAKASSSWRASNSSTQYNLREEITNIENISVTHHEETIRFDKPTVVYVIEYFIRGHKFTSRRSYSEFLYLFKELKNENIPLPEMPAKKPLLGKSDMVIAERRESFDRLLKILIREKASHVYLKEFLQTNQNLPYYGKISKKDSGKLVPPHNSMISETGSRGSRAQNPAEGHVYNGSNNSFRSDSGSQTKVIRDDNVKKGHGPNASYAVDTVKVARGAEDSIYYTLRIIEQKSGSETIIIKRYREFKTLNDMLKKNIDKNYRHKIPDLPHKGPGGAFSNADDPKVVSYRKTALAQYLNKLLNTPEFSGHLTINDFVESGIPR